MNLTQMAVQFCVQYQYYVISWYLPTYFLPLSGNTLPHGHKSTGVKTCLVLLFYLNFSSKIY